MSESEEEADETMNSILNLTPRSVRRTILGSSPRGVGDLEWDSRDMNLEVMSETADSALAAAKRLRRESSTEDPEGFIMVTRRKRRNLRGSPQHTSDEDDTESVCEVSVSAKSALPKQLGFAKLLKNGDVQGVLRVTYKSPFKLYIRFKTDNDAEIFLSSELIKQKEWVCKKTNEVAHTYGVVRDIDMDIEEKDLMSIFECKEEIMAVRRLHKKNQDGQWIKSETIRICFKGSFLPPYVTAYGSRMKVDPYMYPVTQCSKCWRFGHIKNHCPSKSQVCPKCGENHENCEATTYKCVNCKGNHMSIVKSMCPAFTRERNIRVYMSENNYTYKVALRKINENKRNRDADKIPEAGDIGQPENSPPLFSNCEISRPLYRDILCSNRLQRQSQQEEMTEIESRTQPPNNNNTKNKNRKKTSRTKNRKENNIFSESETSTGDSDLAANIIIDSNRRQQRNRRERSTVVKRFLDNLKETILSENDFHTKVQLFIQYIWKEIKSFIEKYITVETILKFIGMQDG